MTESLDLGLEASSGDGHNVTDWCLEQFHERYGDESITKDDIWEYLYGVMHAPDWRERYRHDLAPQSAPGAAGRGLRGVPVGGPDPHGSPRRLRDLPRVPRRRVPGRRSA